MVHASPDRSLDAHDTPDIGGVSRSNRDANGRLIGNGEAGKIDAFWRWFGDSVVTDARFRPVMVFHGTASDFSSFDPYAATVNDTGYMGAGTYFTTDASDASNYAAMASDARFPGQGEGDVTCDACVLPVYLSIRNPYRLPQKDPGTMNMDRDDVLAWTDDLKARGYDGVVNAAGTEWVVFQSTQIKSAIGNSGRYDPHDTCLVDGVAWDMESRLNLDSTGISAAGGDTVAQQRLLAWLGESLLTDDAGDPLVMYHGTTAAFDAFALSDRGTIHFTKDVEIAEQYARNRPVDHDVDFDDGTYDAMHDGEPRILRAHLRLRNPFDPEDQTHRDLFGFRNLRGDWETLEHHVERIKAAGFDGILVNGLDDVAVFSPEQIKSVIGNPSTYDLDENHMHATLQDKGDDVDFLDIGGVMCPTSDAMGRPLAGSDPAAQQRFYEWFGDSKATDEHGRPLVIYHGTTKDFNQFKMQPKGRELGFHFGTAGAAEDRLHDTAKYAKREDFKKGAHTLPVYLSIKNPLRLPDQGNFQVYRLLVATEPLDKPDPKTGATIRMIPGPLVQTGAITQEQANAVMKATQDPDDYYETRARKMLVDMLEANGYDGIVYTNAYEDKGSDSYIVFRPEQIKSAIGNPGTYDPDDLRITDQANWDIENKPRRGPRP